MSAVTRNKQVEDAYPLAPIQEGLLFHALHAPEEGMFVAQYTCVLRHLEVEPFVAAWQRVVDRHPILRTAFVWKNVERPLQVVGRQVGLEVQRLDWRDAGEDGPRRLEELLREDRRRGFDPSRAPLMRLALIQVADDVWRLLWTFHHLVLDGWCRSVLLGEVFELYAAQLTGRAAVLEPPRPYRNYVAWLQRQDRSEAEAFWRRTLSGFTAPTPLPASQAGDAAEEGYGSLEAWLDESATATLQAMARRSRLTLNTVAQGAWALLLAGHAGELDLVYGAVVSGRPAALEGVERMVGVFINTLPMRVEVEPEGRLMPWLAAIQQRLADMRQYEHSALVEVQKLAELPQGSPLFESILAFENFPADGGRAGGGEVALQVEDVRSIARNAYPLAMAVSPGPRLHLRLFHDRGRFPTALAESLVEEYRALLVAMGERPEARLHELPRLAPALRSRVLDDWGTGEQEPAPQGLLPERFAAEAARRPEALAVVGEDATWSYRELDERSTRLAHRLRRLGVGPEVPVGILLPRGAWSVAAVLATWKAGGAYVPLAAELPRRRLEELLHGAGAAALVTGGGLLADSGLDLPVVRIEDEEAAAPVPLPPLPSPRDPRHLAYVLFTSGSTGEPKGVAVEHGQLAHYTDAVQQRLEVPPEATYALVTSLAADLGNTSLLLSLATGGCLHVVGEETARDPARLAAAFERHPPDVLKIVPSHLDALTAGGAVERLLPRHRLVLGGEAPDPQRVAALQRRAPDCVVFNHYGPTESTVGVTTHRLDGRADAMPHGVPLGRPLPRVRLAVVDRLGQPVPVGAAGELWIAGAGLARGYHRRPAATAERFRPDPFASEPGARVYRSGDRVCWLPQGELLFLGRTDLQVKVRGHRVEPREVETVIARHPAVHQAVVAARRDGDALPALHAWVVPRVPQLAEHPEEALFELPDGLTLFHLNRNETRHLYEQIYQQGIYLQHGVTLEDGACVVDVGANIGMFSLWVHRICRRARVIACEPSPASHARLALNAALYGLDLTALQCGVSDRDGSARFTFYPRASIMSGFYADAAEEEAVFRGYMEAHQGVSAYASHAGELAAGRFAAETLDCPLRSLSSLIREHGIERIDLLKVDAEKSEMDVLRGIEPEHWSLVRQVGAEVHDIGDRLQEIRRLLESQGFAVHLEEDATLVGTGIHHLFAHRPETAAVADPRAPRTLAVADEWLAAGDVAGSVRAALEQRLPDYMVPRTVNVVGELPTLASGKIDRNRLPDPAAPAPAGGGGYTAPRSELEGKLADIWGQVLKVERVGVDDDFFRLGGDSILNIQIVARALRAGVKLTPSLLFQNPTVARLAAAVETATAVPAAAAVPDSAVVRPGSPVPMSPVQHWFFAQDGPAPHHYTMPVALTARQRLRPDRLDEALAAVTAHHDALRLRYRRDSTGSWRQTYGEAPAGALLTAVDLAALPAARRRAALEETAAGVQRSLDLARGPLLRGALFELGGGEAQRLLLVAHHLVVDGVSWRILLEDLQTAYGQRLAGGAVELPAPGATFQRWTRGLEELAATSALEDARRRAERLPPEAVALPVDLPGGGNDLASAETVVATLDAEATRSLLTEVPGVYGTHTHEVLLTALVRGLEDWVGKPRLAVDVEGHGREEVLEGVDVSRTVGWFTSHAPLLLDVEGAAAPGEALKRVKEQVRSLPLGGLGHGLARYLAPPASRVSTAAEPLLKLNYLGQLDRALPPDSPFAPAEEAMGPAADPRRQRSHLLEVTALVTGGRLETRWRYSRERHHRETVERLAAGFHAALEALIEHCRSPQAGGYTPSDFPESGLSQDGLDSLLVQLGEGAEG